MARKYDKEKTPKRKNTPDAFIENAGVVIDEKIILILLKRIICPMP